MPTKVAKNIAYRQHHAKSVRPYTLLASKKPFCTSEPAASRLIVPVKWLNTLFPGPPVYLHAPPTTTTRPPPTTEQIRLCGFFLWPPPPKKLTSDMDTEHHHHQRHHHHYYLGNQKCRLLSCPVIHFVVTRFTCVLAREFLTISVHHVIVFGWPQPPPQRIFGGEREFKLVKRSI